MIIRFNKAQLGGTMSKALDGFLDVIQGQRKQEIEVIADQFPYNLTVKTADGSCAAITWDPEAEIYMYVGEPLPEEKPDPNEKVGDIKDWQRPEAQAHAHAQAPEPAPEIKFTLDSVVSQFMGLPKEQRPSFFSEVWKLINAEAGV